MVIDSFPLEQDQDKWNFHVLEVYAEESLYVGRKFNNIRAQRRIFDNLFKCSPITCYYDNFLEILRYTTL
jgi:hypothetical protein